MKIVTNVILWVFMDVVVLLPIVGIMAFSRHL